MNIIIEHLEYLMRRHDCVTVPGIGAFMIRYAGARFEDEREQKILPPSRKIVFNGAITESDGILERSVAKRNGVSFEAAARIVRQEADSLALQLAETGMIAMGRLGELSVTEYGSTIFNPSPVAGWDYRYYGLQPVSVNRIDTVNENMQRELSDDRQHTAQTTPIITGAIAPFEEEQESRRGNIWRKVANVAASIAVLVTLTLFIINPIRIGNEPYKASVAPVEKIEKQQATQSAETEDVVDVATEEALTDDNNADRIDDSAIDSSSADTVETTTGKGGIRFAESDPYCVIIASFPSESQANQYLAENKGRKLGVLNKDGRYRVYVATGDTYAAAESQKALLTEDAWVCRR